MKLLSIITLGLLLSSSSYAKIIILKKCVHSEDLAFNNETYEKHQYKIDTVKKKLSWISVHKESFVQSADNVTNLPRVVVETYNINYIDDEYILASDNM